MTNRLSDIVNVKIDIAAPAIDSASFDNLLIVGPSPAVKPSKPLPAVGVYTDLTEVTDAGYVATGDYADPVGIAARIAFSQNPKPAKIYIAAQQITKPLIAGGNIKIITAENALTDAIPAGVVDGNTANNLPWLQIAYNRTAVSSMEVEVVKDGVVRYGNTLPTTANPDAFLQVCIGATSNPLDDQLGIASGEESGTYIVTLTATRGQKRTVMTRTITFDGANSYTFGATSDETTPRIQSPVETLNDALGMNGWYVVCAAGIPESDFEEIAEWVETQTKLFTYTFLSQTDPVGAVFYRSFGVCGLINDDEQPGDGPTANAYLHVAMTAKCLSYPAGSETWAFKQLASVYPSEISSTLKKVLTEGHSNYFTQYAGRNITMNGQVRAGEWIDVIRGRDWLQNDMQLRLFNLQLKEPKIPYTNSGIAKAQNEMIASLKAGQDRGIVAENEYDTDGNLVPGFTTSVPNSQSLTATQKASRVLQDCKFTARLAGAIHAMDIGGNLTY